MKTNIAIKNFRVFDENGVTIELNPITILTGCNSSGKSSIVKAIFMLDSFLNQIQKDIDNGNPIKLNEYKLDFNTYPNSLLGRFDKVVHSGSSSQQVTMEYTVYSLMLSKDVTVRLVFSADSNDQLNNAYLDSISMSTIDGVFFSSSKGSSSIFERGNKYNFNHIKKECLDFLQIDYLVHRYCRVYSAYDIDGTVSEKDYKENHDKISSILHSLDSHRVKDVVNHVYYAKPNFGNIVIKQEADYDVVEWSKEHGSLFMIPILETLNGISKNQIWSFVEKEVLKCDPEKQSYIASKKIIDSFLESNMDTFGEYFVSFEKKFLNRQEDKTVHGRLQYRYTPNITPGLRISQEYLMFDPRATIVLFDDQGNLAHYSERKSSVEEFENWKNTPIDFDMIYEIVMLWNSLAGYDNAENKKYYEPSFSLIGKEYDHTMIRLFRTFVSELLKELVTPDWCGNMKYVSSSRVSVKRLYPLEVTDDFTQLLKNYFEGIRIYSKSGRKSDEIYEINGFMNKWVEELGIGKSVSVNVDDNGLGVQIRIHKTQGDEGRLLADEGYGITQLVSVLLQIEAIILNAKKPMTNNYLGMDHFKNLIDDYYSETYEETTIAIEEPEIHLHPAYQSKLADMFLEAFEKYNIHFIVETHSEYLIRKLQVLVANKGDETENHVNKEDVSILYVFSPKEVAKGAPQWKQIKICEDGRLDSPFGTGFFDEADNLAMEILRLKAR